MNKNERIANLDRATELLLEAADLVESSIHMSEMERRFSSLPETIRSVAESNDTESISNLIKELQYMDEEHPGWTRPFASPKNITRKDI